MLGKNKTLGILGGGQLGKMVLDVSNRWGLKVYVLDSNIECPSSKLCSKFFVGDLMDFDTVVQFGQNVDLITIEIENVNVEALKFLESKGKKVFPQPSVIEIIQDKSKQKEFYIDNEIPTSSFRSCNGIEELKSLISKGEISYPFIWKASKMGYDGYGVNKISDNKSLEKLSDCHCIIEELISIEKELSVMVGLRESGEILNYPVVEMEFNKDSNQVEYILSPAQISQELKIKAEKLACNIAEKFKICGIIAVEMFLTNQDEILVNEVAPEHLQLMTSNAENLLKKIKNAGAIFIGHNTPEAIGDYIAGPNHVLPTNGTAKFSSGLGVIDFYKRTTIVNCNKESLGIIGKHAITLAEAEGLEAHAMSIALRINK